MVVFCLFFLSYWRKHVKKPFNASFDAAYELTSTPPKASVIIDATTPICPPSSSEIVYLIIFTGDRKLTFIWSMSYFSEVSKTFFGITIAALCINKSIFWFLSNKLEINWETDSSFDKSQ